MKVTVIHKTESVIYNGKIYRNGDSFEADELIAESLIERKYVAPTEAEQEAPAEEENHSYLEEMSYPELKRLAAEKGLDPKGKKEELIARILEAEAETSEGEDSTEEDETSGDLPNTGMPE